MVVVGKNATHLRTRQERQHGSPVPHIHLLQVERSLAHIQRYQ